ncbi:MAG: ATP-binding protein [Gemmatimonadetes bacterium]|nr:ATP-binding protein [Gemmatimonadota bacterium]
MKITEIEIKNFRAFRETCSINLHKKGKNLLIYGENGSGKSSLYLALKFFLESSEDDSCMSKNHQNIFTKGDNRYIKLHIRADQQSREHIYEWSQSTNEANDDLIIEASKTKGFIDYKALLETHYVHRERGTVNVFELLIENLLANTISVITGRSLAEDWDDLQPPFPRRNAMNQIVILEEQVENFNQELASRLEELQKKASEILNKFGYDVALEFDFQGIAYNREEKILDGKQILLKIKFFEREISTHQSFLNEAKLSAIAIAIYFSSILLQPDSKLKILALDDVLIGLDMSNRLPVINILKKYFSEYQIFFMTYDRSWYEIVKQRMADSEWKYAEFYFSKTDEYEVPIYVEDRAYLEKAKEYFNANDYKACVIYLRTAFEVAIKRFCDKKNLKVRYCENPKDLTSEDFWQPIKEGKRKDGTPFLDQTRIGEIELYRSIILNPISHSRIVSVAKKEISEAIEAVEKLEAELK